MRTTLQISSTRVTQRALSGAFGGAETFDILSLVDHATGERLCPADLRRDIDETRRVMRSRVAHDYYRGAERADIQALIAVI